MKTKVYNRSKNPNRAFNLDVAIKVVFGAGLNVVKEYDYVTSGTISINGVGYDWKMTFNQFKFMVAV